MHKHVIKASMELNCLRTKYISLPQCLIRCNQRVSDIELIQALGRKTN